MVLLEVLRLLKFWIKIILLTSFLNLCGCYFPQRNPDVIAKYGEQGEKQAAVSSETQFNLSSPDLETLCKNNQKLSEPIKVVFAPTVGAECEWNKGLNLKRGELGTRVAAFRDQSVEVPIEKDRTICALKFDSNHRMNRYNDAILFLIQDRLIASHSLNNIENKKFLKSAEFALKIRRENIIGLSQSFGKFCPKGVDCSIPRSLVESPISIDVKPEYLKFFAENELRDAIKIDLIMTGNRSIVDCQHTGIEFDFRYTYVDGPIPIAH